MRVGTHGARKNGMVPGEMGLSSGRQSGLSFWATSLVTMEYVEIGLPGLLDMAVLTTHQFFWIAYQDLLKKYQHFDRTRLFGPEWTITQQWTTLNVPWSADYHSTKFMMNLTQSSPVVIVLSQVRSILILILILIIRDSLTAI